MKGPASERGLFFEREQPESRGKAYSGFHSEVASGKHDFPGGGPTAPFEPSQPVRIKPVTWRMSMDDTRAGMHVVSSRDILAVL